MSRSMLDAAWPPSQPPKVNVVAFYIGGGTPHVWTAAEIEDTMARAGARGLLPIFVRVPPTSRDPRAEAAWVADWLASHGVPKGCVHGLDYETAVSNAYWTAYDDVITAAGYRTLLYGSLTAVTQNVTAAGRRPSGGYWAAHWTNTPHICPNVGVTATQYGGDVTIGQPWDISLVGDAVPIWGYTTAEVLDMTGEEHAALMALAGHLDAAVKTITAATKAQRDDALQLGDHGDYIGEMVTGDDYRANAGNNHAAIRADVGAFKDAIIAKLDSFQVAQNVTLSADDRAAIAALVVAELEITGEAQVSGTLAIGPKATP